MAEEAVVDRVHKMAVDLVRLEMMMRDGLVDPGQVSYSLTHTLMELHDVGLAWARSCGVATMRLVEPVQNSRSEELARLGDMLPSASEMVRTHVHGVGSNSIKHEGRHDDRVYRRRVSAEAPDIIGGERR